MAQTIISSPFTDNRMTLTVSHTSHGFDANDIGKAVRSSGTDGQFVVARANSAANAEVVGVITSIDTANQYTITTSGFVDVVAAVPTATAGTVFFLAEADDSQLTSTEPTTVGAVSKPVAVITESNAKMILIHYRGEVLTSTTQTNAPNDAQYVTLAVHGDLSAERVLTAGSGISLTDAGANGAITIANTASSTTINTNADNRIITGSGSAGTLNGEANLTFSTDLSITSGNIVIATAGKGIDFSATANSSGSMSSELLDWYEEGTFTPTIADNDLNASESQAYHTQVGRYVRIGRMVHCHITLHTSSIGNLTTSHGVKILGLPFSSLNSGATVGGGSVYIATSMSLTSGTSITVDVPANVAYCRLQNFDASSGTSTFLLSEWGGTGNILLSLSYEAA